MQQTQQQELTKRKLMDSNEPGSIRMKLWEIGWEQARLSTGDYAFWTADYKKVGIERKAVNDLMASLGDRLSRQLENSLEYYDIVILLIEGSWSKVSPGDKLVTGRGIEYTSWQMTWNYLERFQDKGVRIQLSINEGHTVQRLNELYALYQKPYSLSARSKDFTDDRVLSLPSGTRGSTGQEVLNNLGSIQAVANASIEELLAVDGIGKKKAELIYSHMRKNKQ